MKNYILLTAAALMLGACSNDENLDNPNGPVELRLTSGLEVQTRAAHGLNTQLKTVRRCTCGWTMPRLTKNCIPITYWRQATKEH